MPRYSRTFLRGYPHHIVQRGHDRKAVFACEEDYAYYLDNLREQLEARAVSIYAYCLMTNHVHLLLEPLSDECALSDLMRVVSGRQTRYVNRLERRSGTLWEGRFKCSLVDRDSYLLACIRYIEMNPVKAGIVANPADYRWSSCGTRQGSKPGGLQLIDLADRDQLALKHSYRQLEEAEQASVNGDLDRDELIRQALARNQLTGSLRFYDEIEQKLGRRISNLPPGRPRRDRLEKK